jgi:hypothetical protein
MMPRTCEDRIKDLENALTNLLNNSSPPAGWEAVERYVEAKMAALALLARRTNAENRTVQVPRGGRQSA